MSMSKEEVSSTSRDGTIFTEIFLTKKIDILILFSKSILQFQPSLLIQFKHVIQKSDERMT